MKQLGFSKPFTEMNCNYRTDDQGNTGRFLMLIDPMIAENKTKAFDWLRPVSCSEYFKLRKWISTYFNVAYSVTEHQTCEPCSNSSTWLARFVENPGKTWFEGSNRSARKWMRLSRRLKKKI